MVALRHNQDVKAKNYRSFWSYKQGPRMSTGEAQLKKVGAIQTLFPAILKKIRAKR